MHFLHHVLLPFSVQVHFYFIQKPHIWFLFCNLPCTSRFNLFERFLIKFRYRTVKSLVNPKTKHLINTSILVCIALPSRKIFHCINRQAFKILPSYTIHLRNSVDYGDGDFERKFCLYLFHIQPVLLSLYVLYFVILPLISQKNSVDSINYILKH